MGLTKFHEADGFFLLHIRLAEDTVKSNGGEVQSFKYFVNN